MEDSDIPFLNKTEIRALFYIHQVNNEQEETPNLSTLAEETEWSSKYFTRAWQKLQPRGLVNVDREGRHTRLSLTENGEKAYRHYLGINEALTQ